MRFLTRPGTYVRRHQDRAGDPLDGLVNLFDLSLVLAVGFLVAGFSAIGATGLLSPTNPPKPLTGQPQANGPSGNGTGKPVGTVYQLQNGQFIFQPNAGTSTGFPKGGATPSTGATGTTGSGVTPTSPPSTGTPNPGTSTIPPASSTPQPPVTGAVP